MAAARRMTPNRRPSPLARALAVSATLFAVTPALTLTGCGNGHARGPITGTDGVQREIVVLDGTPFNLDVSADIETRTLGLGGREHIPADGGMLFIFPEATQRQFVMRDCPIDIDIIYVNSLGRIVGMHQMKAEAPRGENESAMAYENRLKRYPSGSAAQFVIELAGGRLDDLDLTVGQKLDLDLDRLKALAK